MKFPENPLPQSSFEGRDGGNNKSGFIREIALICFLKKYVEFQETKVIV